MVIEYLPGDRVFLGDQLYRFQGRKPHTRIDGSETHLNWWQSECATCGKPFQCASPEDKPPGARRCMEHRAPGVRVKRKA